MTIGKELKILAICETIDYQNFTRRATFDAIADVGNLDALCHTSVLNLFRTNLKSEHTKVYCYYRLLPHKLHNVPLLRTALRPYEHRWIRFFNKYDVVIISSPLQAYLLEFCTKKVIFLLSDPYHLMGYQYNDEKRILEAADIILATSHNLCETYLHRYFGHELNNVFYWPNTADLSLWDHTKYTKRKVQLKQQVLGFAGNFMKIVDLALLDLITDHFSECTFRIAGKISCDDQSFRSKLESIFVKSNVSFLGFIPFNDLPSEVAKWDICLMLDDKSELSSYHHHNKLYQYLALGKPIVAQRNHGDYDDFKDVIYLANGHEEFVSCVDEALAQGTNDDLRTLRIDTAHKNSSMARAQEFFNILSGTLQ